MCITNVNLELKPRLCSIVVPEFKGIDNLPSKIKLLDPLQ